MAAVHQCETVVEFLTLLRDAGRAGHELLPDDDASSSSIGFFDGAAGLGYRVSIRVLGGAEPRPPCPDFPGEDLGPVLLSVGLPLHTFQSLVKTVRGRAELARCLSVGAAP